MSLFHIILVLKYFLFLVSLTNADLLQVGLPSVLSLPLLFVTKYCNIFSVTGSFKDFVRESILKFSNSCSHWSTVTCFFITFGLRSFPIGPLPKLQNVCVPIGLWWALLLLAWGTFLLVRCPSYRMLVFPLAYGGKLLCSYWPMGNG